MLILFLQIKGHCGEQEIAYIECIITTVLISSVICSTQSSREVLRIRQGNNVLGFLLLENNS
jgi:hypothetical protein